MTFDDFTVAENDLSADHADGLLGLFDIEAWQRDPDAPPVAPARRTRTDPVELWLRSPQHYLEVLQTQPFPRFVFSVNDIVRRHYKPSVMLAKALPAEVNFSYMIVGSNYTEIYTRDAETYERVPSWAYGHDPATLLRLCKTFPDRGWSRIVVGFLPRQQPHEAARVIEWLYRVAAAYPQVRLHLHGSNSFRHLFGLNFHSGDVNAGDGVRLGAVHLPNGRHRSVRELGRDQKWVHVLGYSVADLRESINLRRSFNLAAALWAAEHWNDPQGLKPLKQRQREDPLGLMECPPSGQQRRSARRDPATLQARFARPPIDPDEYPQLSPKPTEAYAYAEPVTNLPLVPINPRRPDNGDKIVCNACSLSAKCRAFREGAVCTVADSPMIKLSQMFGTSDAVVVRNALGAVVSAQAERYERTAVAWREDNESDIHDIRKSEHLMKMENSLTRSAEALVKILDPSFRESGVPAINASVTHIYNPRVLVADVVKQLEAAGVDRSQIDPTRIVDAARERGMIQ